MLKIANEKKGGERRISATYLAIVVSYLCFLQQKTVWFTFRCKK